MYRCCQDDTKADSDDVAVDIDGIVLNPKTFPDEIESMLSVLPDYIWGYKDEKGKDVGGRRSFAYNGKDTRYEPLKFQFEGLTVLSDGIQQQKEWGTENLKDKYQITLTFPRDYKSDEHESNNTFRILEAIDKFMPKAMVKGGTWNGDRVKSVEVAESKYGPCLKYKKEFVTKDGKEIPAEELDEWAEDDKFPKYPPNIHLDVKQVFAPTYPNDPKRKHIRSRTPAFKPAVLDHEGTLIPLSVYNYANVIKKGTVVDGIAQIDFVSSTKSAQGRTTIGLSLIQLQMRAPEQFGSSDRASANYEIPRVYKLKRKSSFDDTQSEAKKVKV